MNISLYKTNVWSTQSNHNTAHPTTPPPIHISVHWHSQTATHCSEQTVALYQDFTVHFVSKF
jgi:hypothetical protein